MKSNSFLAIAATVLMVGCASGKSDSGIGNTKVDIPQPTLQLVQLSNVPAAAEYTDATAPVKFELRVRNNAQQAITLKRVLLQSMGVGAYNVSPTSRPFDKKIDPGATEAVQFFIPTQSAPSATGANGPVTIRTTASFDSPDGQFQAIDIGEVAGAVAGRAQQ